MSLESRLQELLCLNDFEDAARAHLPASIFAYIAGAAETNRSFRDNREAFDDWRFVPRTLVNVAERDTSVELFGQRYAMPFGVAPMGLTALFGYQGDLALARAAASTGVPMIMSGSSLMPMETIAKHCPGSWFQAYLPGEDAAIEALIARVDRAGFRTLVITVDTPIAANRENNVRAGFSTPLRPTVRLALSGLSHPRWLFGTLLRTLWRHGMPHFENNFATRGQPILSSSIVRDFSNRCHLNWTHLRAVRKAWRGQLVVKGVLSAEDAMAARDLGADGLIVSNHGGRQLDGSVAPLRVLPGIVAACPELPVMMDSGVRRGTDVLKALALGARLVFVGRPFSFALTVGAQRGVEHALGLLGAEVSRDMAMLGVTRIDELDAKRHLWAQR